ncbi:MAG TPA: 2-dehydropantoate 2-reductase [Enteractinococcus sp.]
MKIGIVGAGAMGRLFGAHLIAAGRDVTMIDASGAVLDDIRQHGINVDMGTYQFHVRAAASKAADVLEHLDIVMVFTKGFHTEAALQSVRHVLTPDSIGISLQNGIGNDEPLIRIFGYERTVLGMTDFPSDLKANGTVVSEATGRVVLGALHEGGQDSAHLMRRILNESKMHTTYAPDIMIPIWEKVIFNTVYNTVSAATGLTVGEVFDRPEAAEIATLVLSESLEVVRNAGVEIDEDRLQSNIENAHKHHSQHKTSMLIDLEAGRKTEIETIGGAVERVGKTKGVATPTLSVLCNMVRLRERTA